MARTTQLTPERIKQVALLLSRGNTQKDICTRIGMKQATVSRAKKLAIEQGYLVQRLHCILSAAEIEDIEYQLNSPELYDQLRRLQRPNAQNLLRLRIVDPGRPKPLWTEQRTARYRDDLGKRVAEYLLDGVFPHIRSMGVTWGGTLLAVVRGIEAELAKSSRGLADIEFLPACGSPPDASEAAPRSSSYLVASLDLVINDTWYNPNNFPGVSASISAQFKPAERRALEKYFRQNKGYCRVFGSPEQAGRIEAMDSVITSVGSSNPVEDPWIKGGAEAAGISPEKLSRCVIGDIGGWFLAREDLRKAEAELVDRVNERWTGIKLEHYLSCNERARSRGHGGTILVSSGNKAEIVLECIRRGLVTELLIDSQLAKRLGKAIGFRPGDVQSSSEGAGELVRQPDQNQSHAAGGADHE